MTKLPIHTLLDKDKKPFIPFVTAKCIPLDGTGDTVYDRLEALNNKEVVQPSVATEVTAVYNYQTLPISDVTPTEANQLVNKQYVDASITNVDVGGGGMPVIYLSENSRNNPMILTQAKAGIYIMPDYSFYFKKTETDSYIYDEPLLDKTVYVLKDYEDAEENELFLHYMKKQGRTGVATKKSTGISTGERSTGSYILHVDSAPTINSLYTFNKLPESSKVPTTDNQFTNKKYVDDAIANAAPAVDTTTLLNYKGHVASVEDLPSTGQASGTATAEVAVATYDFTENTATTQAATGYDYFISVGNTRVSYSGVISTNFPEIIEWLNIGKYSGDYFVATAYVNASEEKPAYLSGYYESRTGIAVTLTSTGITDARNDGILTEPAIVYFGHLYKATTANSYIKGNLPAPLKYKPLTDKTWYYRHQYSNLGTYNYALTGYTSLKLDFADGYTYTDGMQMLTFDPETYKAIWVLNESMAIPNEVYTVGDDHQVYHCDNTPKWNRWNNTYSKSEIDEMLGNAEAVLTEVLEGTTV